MLVVKGAEGGTLDGEVTEGGMACGQGEGAAHQNYIAPQII